MGTSVPQNLAGLACQECSAPLSGRMDALIHILHGDVWEAQRGGPAAHWQAHCNTCNPHRDDETRTWCGGCYAFEPGIHTVDWDDHLNDKSWIGYTDWASFYAAAA